MLAVIIDLAVADTFRLPGTQFIGWAYIQAVRAYQLIGSDLLLVGSNAASDQLASGIRSRQFKSIVLAKDWL